MATQQQQDQPGVGIADIAAKLGTQPTRLRAFIRTLDLGVGRGTRYVWPSLADPTVKRIVREWTKAHAEPEAEQPK